MKFKPMHKGDNYPYFYDDIPNCCEVYEAIKKCFPDEFIEDLKKEINKICIILNELIESENISV